MNSVHAADLVRRYYAAFNDGDWAGMCRCLSNDFRHHVNEGARRDGKAKFAEFLGHMDRCYSEQLSNIVVMTNGDGTRASAEFTVSGTYKETDGELPAARGQTYKLPAGSFFEIGDDGIRRVTTYYNLADWVAQVSK